MCRDHVSVQFEMSLLIVKLKEYVLSPFTQILTESVYRKKGLSLVLMLGCVVLFTIYLAFNDSKQYLTETFRKHFLSYCMTALGKKFLQKTNIVKILSSILLAKQIKSNTYM